MNGGHIAVARYKDAERGAGRLVGLDTLQTTTTPTILGLTMSPRSSIAACQLPGTFAGFSALGGSIACSRERPREVCLGGRYHRREARMVADSVKIGIGLHPLHDFGSHAPKQRLQQIKPGLVVVEVGDDCTQSCTSYSRCPGQAASRAPPSPLRAAPRPARRAP